MQYAKPVTLNVEECDRLSFLPYLFGNDFLYAEAYVYALAQKMMPEYQGGFWHFIRLPDGGGYMMPDGDRFHLVNGEPFGGGAPLWGAERAIAGSRPSFWEATFLALRRPGKAGQSPCFPSFFSG